jgi:hypothetical protein
MKTLPVPITLIWRVLTAFDGTGVAAAGASCAAAHAPNVTAINRLVAIHKKLVFIASSPEIYF